MKAYVAEKLFVARPGTPLIKDGCVLVDDAGFIRAAGPVKHVIKKSHTRIDVPGVLLPGLIDVHTHLCLSASPNPGADIEQEHRARTAHRAAANLGLHLDAGVTTIRDVGGVDGIDLEMARMVDEGVLDGPDVFAAGRLICMTGGHACFLGTEVDTPGEARKAARTQLKLAARVLKVIATGGVITKGVRPGAAQLTVEEMRAVCDEAQKASKTVAAHAQGSEGIENALAAGVDSIEHGFWLSAAAIKTMKSHGRTLVPTFAALRTMRANVSQLPDFIAAKLDEVERPQRQSFQKAFAAGVRVATGTDAGTPFNPHGNIKEELVGFAEAGVPSEDIWRAATLSGAEVLQLTDRGALEPRMRADFIAITASAFTNVKRFTAPHLVVKAGRVLRGAERLSGGGGRA